MFLEEIVINKVESTVKEIKSEKLTECVCCKSKRIELVQIEPIDWEIQDFCFVTGYKCSDCGEISSKGNGVTEFIHDQDSSNIIVRLDESIKNSNLVKNKAKSLSN